MDNLLKIVDKAHTLFRMYGVRSTSMDKIANSLGISKKTIYRFFKSKDHLVTAFVDKEISIHTGRCELLKAKNNDAILELFFLLIHTKEFYQTLYPALVHDLKNNRPDAFRRYSTHRDGYLTEVIKANMISGVKSDLYRNDFNFDILAQFILVSLRIVLDPNYPSLNRHAGILIEYLPHGMLTAKWISVLNAYKGHKGGPLSFD